MCNGENANVKLCAALLLVLNTRQRSSLGPEKYWKGGAREIQIDRGRVKWLKYFGKLAICIETGTHIHTNTHRHGHKYTHRTKVIEQQAGLLPCMQLTQV